MPSSELHFGFERETGERVSVPVAHTIFTGITRHGKSEAMSAMAERAADGGYKVLLFDVKANRDYDDTGTEVPIYFHETADPITIKSLLESVVDAPVSVDFAELVKVYERGDSYSDVLDRVRDAIDDDRHPVEENKLIVIEHLLERLVGDLGDVEIQDDLALHPGVNVMDLSQMDDAVQQIAIASTVEEVKRNRSDVIVGIDEAHNFIPQKGKPPAFDPIVDLIREGGASGIWVWLSDQTITGVDKDPLKLVGVWLLGKQREKNEAGRVIEQIPGRSGVSKDDVMTLSKGHFVVALDDASPIVYAQPRWLPDREAESVAIHGETALEDIDQPGREDMQDVESELQEKEDRIRELESQLDERDERIQELQREVEKLNTLLEDMKDGDQPPEPTPASGGGGVDEDAVREIIQEFIEEAEVPGEVSVEATRSKLVVRHRVEPVQTDTESRLGRVAYLYAEDDLPADKWFTTGDVEDILERRGWGDTSVKRTSVLNDLTKMGFLEQKTRSDRTRLYRVVMPPDIAENKGLLEVSKNVA